MEMDNCNVTYSKYLPKTTQDSNFDAKLTVLLESSGMYNQNILQDFNFFWNNYQVLENFENIQNKSCEPLNKISLGFY